MLQPAEGENLATYDVTLMLLAPCEVLALHCTHGGPLYVIVGENDSRR